MQNELPNALRLTALVAGFLVAFSFVSSEWQIGDFTVKKMDILSDVRKGVMPVLPVEKQDSVGIEPIAATKPAADCPDSLTCIEDFTPGGDGLRLFFKKIDSLRRGLGGQVRVAFFGDSFVEGDILLADLRDSLQKNWGGRGAGFLPVAGTAAGNMRSVNFTSGNGWDVKDIVHDDRGPLFGINGHFFSPRSTSSWYNFEASRFYPQTGRWSEARVFYQKNDSLAIAYRVNSGEKVLDEHPRFGPEIEEFRVKSTGMGAFAASFGPVEGLSVFGCSVEEGKGFYIDNFSTRGNTGRWLKKVEPSVYRRFDKLMGGYDLIVLQYGMNAVTSRTDNVKWYEKELDETVEFMKENFPGRPILFVGCPDRGGNVGGEIHTMPVVPMIVEMQRRLAERHGLLFYDLFAAMGGPDATARLAEAKPILAYKDYTHLTHDGGKIIGQRMARAFLQAEVDYQKEKPSR